MPTMDDLKRHVQTLERNYDAVVTELQRLEAKGGPDSYIYRRLLQRAGAEVNRNA